MFSKQIKTIRRNITAHWDKLMLKPGKSFLNAALADINSNFKNGDSKDEIKTGFESLVFKKGELIVLSGRSCVGKTSFALSLVKNISLNDKNAAGLIIPGNMEEAYIGQRLISICSSVPLCRFKSGKLSLDDYEKIESTVKALYDSKVFVFYEPNCSLFSLKEFIKTTVKECSDSLVIIDGFEYLEDIIDSDKKSLRYNLEHVIDVIKKCAREFYVPIMLVTDLPDVKDGSEPSIVDFGKQLIIPHKADKVLLLSREEPYGTDDYLNAKLIMSKNTSGPKEDLFLKFVPFTSVFYTVITGVRKN